MRGRPGSRCCCSPGKPVAFFLSLSGRIGSDQFSKHMFRNFTVFLRNCRQLVVSFPYSMKITFNLTHALDRATEPWTLCVLCTVHVQTQNGNTSHLVCY